MNIAIGLSSVVLLTLATAYFVAQEFAYVAVDRGRLQQLAEEGDKSALRALRVTSQLSFTLSGAQLGITVTALLVGYVSEPYLGRGLADLLAGPTGMSEAASLSISVVIALIFSTAIQMVVGELAPKNYAIARPVPLARWLSRSTLLYLKIAGPIIRLFDGASTKLLRAVGIEPVEELSHGASPEDLQHIIDESEAGGLLDSDLTDLLDRGLAFGTLTAGEAMTPRVDVETVSAQASVQDVVALLEGGHSRFPVVGESIDDVVGLVGTREVLTVPARERATRKVADVMDEPVRVPDTVPLPGALEQLRAVHRQLAVVVDEYGGLAGVLTLEDILEEVVGEIEDEGDEPESPEQWTTGEWEVPARLRLDEVESMTGIALPESDDYDTVGGLVLAELGRTAEVGDQVELAWIRQEEEPERRWARLVVDAVSRHVPETIRVLDLGADADTDVDAEQGVSS